jgi:hypothetical protein
MSGRSLLTPRQIESKLQQRGTPRKRGTLAQWRRRGGGPPFLRFLAEIRYPEEDFEAWYAENCSAPVNSTAELVEPPAEAPPASSTMTPQKASRGRPVRGGP